MYFFISLYEIIIIIIIIIIITYFRFVQLVEQCFANLKKTKVGLLVNFYSPLSVCSDEIKPKTPKLSFSLPVSLKNPRHLQTPVILPLPSHLLCFQPPDGWSTFSPTLVGSFPSPRYCDCCAATPPSLLLAPVLLTRWLLAASATAIVGVCRWMEVIVRLLIAVGVLSSAFSSPLYSFATAVIALPLPPSPPTCAGCSKSTIGTEPTLVEKGWFASPQVCRTITRVRCTSSKVQRKRATPKHQYKLCVAHWKRSTHMADLRRT